MESRASLGQKPYKANPLIGLYCLHCGFSSPNDCISLTLFYYTIWNSIIYGLNRNHFLANTTTSGGFKEAMFWSGRWEDKYTGVWNTLGSNTYLSDLRIFSVQRELSQWKERQMKIWAPELTFRISSNSEIVKCYENTNDKHLLLFSSPYRVPSS